MGRSATEHPKANLPASSGEIIGRKSEIATVRQLLSTTRLLTLTGAGGVGKTRLATYVAAHVQRAFPDGVWLVELASVQDEHLLGVAVAEALGMLDEVPQPSTQCMIEYLRNKHMLLVLDNCEHLVEACAALADTLLTVAPQVQVLATSRESLGVPGETLFIVPPLSFPAAHDRVAESDLLRYDALTLLVERAKNIAPEFDIASRYVAAAQLCRLLDGIPLAIELAAVWLRVLSLDQIINRLGDRLHFLTQGYRTALPRHQTLRAAVEWSFDLCSSQEQILWERLSVFFGGFDLSAAEEVCSTEPLARKDILPLLAELTEKSIVISETRGARSRYWILETLRQYGNERLVKSEPKSAIRRRHAEHYQSLAEQNRDCWFGPDQVNCLATIAPEMSNMRAALDYSLGEEPRIEEAIRMFTSLYGYWIFFGGPAEARHWFDRLLKYEQMSSRSRFDVLAVGALFALMLGRLDIAQPLIEECQSLAGYSGYDEAKAMGRFLSGRLALLKGDYQDAVSLLEPAQEWYEHNLGEIPRTRVLRDAFLPAFYLALASIFAEDPGARHWTARCREIAERAGAPGEISMGMWAAGVERWRAGDLEQAASMFLSSLRLERSTGYRYSSAWTVESLAWIAAAQGRNVHAARLIGAAGVMRRLLEVSLEGFRAYDDAHRACEASLRARLSEEEYQKAVDKGASLDFDEAIGYALQEPAEPQPGSAPAAAPPQSVLTSRELEVAQLIAEGVRNKEIAARLVISQRTAEGHVEHILEKLGFTSRTQIAAWYVNHVAPSQNGQQ
ncbi:ATP-binding protein [Nonomuraea aurantiaca]|uniref:ATP-binding protein n=1 Tax=Nonomuraea aurantiaca TaxID=2878562 RepID=UPI001CD91B7B|nr:LuxR C-terminal-related transcriptional regulator [Nonomuraea aurantiaca]MCA2229989.1 LuxR C-terminal-related transcriptional regulator [Nonomuraea aurantiaca]